MAGPDDPSDRELFDDAVGGLGDPGVDDRDDREPRPPQPRDPPTGRWTSREEEAASQDDAGEQDQEQPQGRIPSYRQREEAERRRAAEERVLRSERMFDQLAQRFGSLEEELRALRRPQQQPQQRPDVWRDPDAFVEDIDRRFQTLEQLAEAKARDKMINLTFRREHRSRGAEFEQAYTVLQGMTRRGDRLANEIVNDADPGAALMEWYDGERLRAELGNDPDGYVERRTADRIQKDPNFRKQMAQMLGFELLDGGGGGDGGYQEPARNGRSGNRTLVRLPSVNSASGSSGGNRRGNGQMPVTDGDFFADAVAGLPTSRMRAAARGR